MTKFQVKAPGIQDRCPFVGPNARRAISRRDFLASAAAATYLIGCKTTGLDSQLKSKKQDIAYLAIHPGIGVARIGNNKKPDGYYIGPELVDGPHYTDLATMRDPASGALNRQAARFRIYAFNEDKEVLREITADEAQIEWTVQVANRKAEWFQFRAALDIPEARGRADMAHPRRNASIQGADRKKLVIAPKPQSITGKNAKSAAFIGSFDGSQGRGHIAEAREVQLGELRTDAQGRLLFLGGFGDSGSPLRTPVFNPADINTFNNADGWYDDTCDGLVSAKVTLGDKAWNADQAWVIVAPPNYAPDVLGWRTLYDLLVDTYVNHNMMPMPSTTSFQKDILPILQRLARTQWVNKGFALDFARGGPYDFEDQQKLALLADNSAAGEKIRSEVFNKFRFPDDNDRRKWPQIYGDAFGSFDDLPERSVRNDLAIYGVRAEHLKRWRAGQFKNDFQIQKPRSLPKRISQTRQNPIPETDPFVAAGISIDAQPDELDRAALDYCLADAFHPGCELTYPMRHVSMYRAKFRIKVQQPDPDGMFTPRDYGSTLTTDHVESPDGPFGAQIPGSVTQWMAIPWQGDTVFCRSGYDPEFSPYVPAYWPARVPNQVLTEEDYKILMDPNNTPEKRLEAYQRRASWVRAFKGGLVSQIEQMVDEFGLMGIIVAMPGPTDKKVDVPPVVLVEFAQPSMTGARQPPSASKSGADPKLSDREKKILEAGWPSVEVFEEFKRVRRGL
ncbi:MAG: LodA/GoxA family CTQ-dependent oxidase [Proteobacteria bacterium]|nr:LodA/GoxA family CTQ-dependent oxidase [Pseudomonadota bacterium]